MDKYDRQRKDIKLKRIEHYLVRAGLPTQFYVLQAQLGEGLINFYDQKRVNAAKRMTAKYENVPLRKDFESSDYYTNRLKYYKPQSIFIYGPSGKGKTIFASWILHQIITRHPKFHTSCMFLNIPQWLESLRPGRDVETENVLERACTADVLVLDDLGSEVLTQWVFEKLYLVYNTRRDSQLPTITTSNYSLGELEQVFQEKNNLGASRLITRLAQATLWLIN